MNLRDRMIRSLLIHAHFEIEMASKKAVQKINSPDLFYPPADETGAKPILELKNLSLSEAQKTELESVISNAIASAMMGLFTSIDGVGTPENWPRDEFWSGLRLVVCNEDIEKQFREFLHDEFLSYYWDYIEK